MWVSCSHWLWAAAFIAWALTRLTALTSVCLTYSSYACCCCSYFFARHLPPKRRRFHAFASLRFAGQQTAGGRRHSAGTRQPVGGTQRVACRMRRATPGRRFKQLTRHTGTVYSCDAVLISRAQLMQHSLVRQFAMLQVGRLRRRL